MCLTMNSMYMCKYYDKQDYENFQIKKEELQMIILLIKSNCEAKCEPPTKKNIKEILKAHNLFMYFEHTHYFYNKLNDVLEADTNWEKIWGKGENTDKILKLYDIWWRHMDHNKKYCVSPRVFAIKLLLISNSNVDKFRYLPCKTIKEKLINEYIGLGFAKYLAACVIQRFWKRHSIKRNICARKIQKAWQQCVVDPSFTVCKNRLNKEFLELDVV